MELHLIARNQSDLRLIARSTIDDLVAKHYKIAEEEIESLLEEEKTPFTTDHHRLSTWKLTCLDLYKNDKLGKAEAAAFSVGQGGPSQFSFQPWPQNATTFAFKPDSHSKGKQDNASNRMDYAECYNVELDAMAEIRAYFEIAQKVFFSKYLPSQAYMLT